MKRKTETLIRTNVHLSVRNRAFLKKEAKRVRMTPAALLRTLIDAHEMNMRERMR